MTGISVTIRQLSRFISTNTSSVSMKESNKSVNTVTRKALPSLILEGTKKKHMRVLFPPVQSVQYFQFEQFFF